MPDLSYERRLTRESGLGETVRVCGIDEAGRGPLAGPVVAAAVVFRPPGPPRRLLRRLDDSKVLSPAVRSALVPDIHEYAEVAIGSATVAEIDAINILQATMLAMRRAVAALASAPDHALVDDNRAPALACTAETVIGGDGICASIAAASIVAKVTRDAQMAALADLHPGYGWERNAGYGTPEHHAALIRLGVSPEHRRSFRPVSELLTIRA